MSVKRYDFDCYAFYDSARLSVNKCEDGEYVLHSDYAALEARHNALREAVAWERECDAFIKGKDCSFHLAWEHLQAARAEVDRLIAEGHADKRATEIYAHVTDTRQRDAIRKVMAGPVDLGD